jgi:hypothetical protein
VQLLLLLLLMLSGWGRQLLQLLLPQLQLMKQRWRSQRSTWWRAGGHDVWRHAFVEVTLAQHALIAALQCLTILEMQAVFLSKSGQATRFALVAVGESELATATGEDVWG